LERVQLHAHHEREMKRIHAAKVFLEQVMEESLSNENLSVCLQDGVLLCRLLLAFKPGSIRKYNPEPRFPFKMIENCFLALEVCKESNMHVGFTAMDIYNQHKLVHIVDLILVIAERMGHTPPNKIDTEIRREEGEEVEEFDEVEEVEEFEEVEEVEEGGEEEEEREEGEQGGLGEQEGDANNALVEPTTTSVYDTSATSDCPPPRVEKQEQEREVKEERKERRKTAARQREGKEVKVEQDLDHNKMRKNVFNELLKSEANYVKSLDMLVNEFVNPMKKFMNAEHVKSIFSTTKNIMISNKKMLQSLTERSKDEQLRIGDILVEFIADIKQYEIYCNNLENAFVTLENRRKEDTAVADFLEGVEFTPQCGHTNLATLLSKPLARLAKYLVLAKDILQYTGENHPDYRLLVGVLSELEKMASSVHEARKRSDNLHKILEIQNSISGGKKLHLWRPGREYSREGDFLTLSKTTTQRRHFFLFNDCIIFACEAQAGFFGKKPEHLFDFKGQYQLAYCVVEDAPDMKEFKNIFHLTCASKEKKKRKKYIICSSSYLEKTLWMRDLSSLIEKSRKGCNDVCYL